MLNPKTNERELCYVVKIDNVLDMEGVNNQIAVVNGWTVFVKRGSFKPGDLAIYFEIDSRVPATEQFAFLEKYNYAVKTQKYVKGKVISQGLLMHPFDFGWNVDMMYYYDPITYTYYVDKDKSYPIIKTPDGETYHEGDFLTIKLGVTYYEPEDNSRKADTKKALKEEMLKKFDKWVEKHTILSKLPFAKKIKKKKLYNKYFGKKNKVKVNWPSWVVKTDEERAQNMPQLFNPEHRLHNLIYVATEKLDGTSTTFTMRRDGTRRDRKEYYVCSRNMVYNEATANNTYVEMSKQYNMKKICEDILNKNKDLTFVTIQGETYGLIQKRKYGNKNRLAIFNLIFGYKNGIIKRYNPIEMTNFFRSNYPNIECVPIVDDSFYLPDTCEELLKYATGSSKIDGGMREGIVFRSLDGEVSFKAVSNEFLLKYHS